MNTPNRHRVPAKQWRKWSDTARPVFNAVYSQITKNHELFLAPGASSMTARQWRVTAWNAAWVAADAADGRHGD